VLSYGAFLKLFEGRRLMNCALIIDEAHNIFSEQTQGSYASSFRELLQNRKNCSVFLMTATPMRNNVFELFMMLRELTLSKNGGNQKKEIEFFE
jgi:superfamily II DNA or RNA helicase